MGIWNRLFLDERPSISLAFFRIAVALTVGFHVIPSFLCLDDNYLRTAFKIVNTNFFPVWAIELVQKSPDAVVIGFVWLFLIAWFMFLFGIFSQLSCILLTASCYYFYALNSFQIGTLSWDILLVTLFLMCITSYPGDYFSIDALNKGEEAYRRRRPYFLQRLLQMQIAFTFFYTGLFKIIGHGNWLRDNPLWYLMNYPPSGVTKNFMLKEFLSTRPELCYWIGIAVIVVELAFPFLLWCHRTRLSAVIMGFFFHILLILTLDVPAIFFFLFPAQLLLFIDPERVLDWIEQKRTVNRSGKRSKLIYDGKCGFCRHSVGKLKAMDLFAAIEYVDLHTIQDWPGLHPDLNKDKAMSQMYLIETDGRLYGGFAVFRRLCFVMPMLYVTIPVVYFPGAMFVGSAVYRWVANNRYLFHANKVCRDNACFRKP